MKKIVFVVLHTFQYTFYSFKENCSDFELWRKQWALYRGILTEIAGSLLQPGQ